MKDKEAVKEEEVMMIKVLIEVVNDFVVNGGEECHYLFNHARYKIWQDLLASMQEFEEEMEACEFWSESKPADG